MNPRYQEVIIRNLHKPNKIQLQSTNYLKSLHFPTHDCDYHNEEKLHQSDGEQLNEYTETERQSGYQIENDGSDGVDQSNDIDQGVVIRIPNYCEKLCLISSLCQSSSKNMLLSSIDQKKKNYHQLLKKKEENRLKFIQKINQNLNDSHLTFITPSENTKKELPSKKIISMKSSSQQKKISRNQTEQNRPRKGSIDYKKQTESNYCFDKESEIQIDFNLTSKRQESTKEVEEKYKSAKKKVTIKKKKSESSSVKNQRFQQQPKFEKASNKINESTSKKVEESTIGKSINEFLFIEQYQKDQKQIMNRLLNIIEQDHTINRNGAISGGISFKGSMVGENNHEVDNLMMSKMRQRSLNNSMRFASSSINPMMIETQFSSVKPIVINNYIKSPTQFMDRGLIQKQMTIKMLEQNRQNNNSKKRSNDQSIINSRIVQENKGFRQVSKFKSQQDNCKKQSQYCSKLSTIRKKQQEQLSRLEKCQNINEKSQNQSQKEEQSINFQLLYQKLKIQTKKVQSSSKVCQDKTSQSNQNAPKQDKKIKLPESQSIINLPINSSRHQPSSHQNEHHFTNTKLTTTHLKAESTTFSNTSQNVTEFNPNCSIQTQFIQPAYDLKKPSVSMEITFGNQSENKKNVSLADAFKKKFGANRLVSKGKSLTKINQEGGQSIEPLSELKTSQNNGLNVKTQQKNQQTSKHYSSVNNGKKDSSFGAKNTIKITNKRALNPRDKQNMNTLQTPRSHSQHYNSTQRSICTNLSKEPSKQLLDRLIYGQKITMTKKQMYQLSKKNYMKLPEIEQKRKQQEKKLKQVQRLEKIKQYQKRIRSNKNSVCKESLIRSSVLDQNAGN